MATLRKTDNAAVKARKPTSKLLPFFMNAILQERQRQFPNPAGAPKAKIYKYFEYHRKVIPKSPTTEPNFVFVLVQVMAQPDAVEPEPAPKSPDAPQRQGVILPDAYLSPSSKGPTSTSAWIDNQNILRKAIQPPPRDQYPAYHTPPPRPVSLHDLQRLHHHSLKRHDPVRPTQHPQPNFDEEEALIYHHFEARTSAQSPATPSPRKAVHVHPEHHHHHHRHQLHLPPPSPRRAQLPDLPRHLPIPHKLHLPQVRAHHHDPPPPHSHPHHPRHNHLVLPRHQSPDLDQPCECRACLIHFPTNHANRLSTPRSPPSNGLCPDPPKHTQYTRDLDFTYNDSWRYCDPRIRRQNECGRERSYERQRGRATTRGRVV